MDQVLAIYNQNKKYLRKLTEYLERRKQLPFHILSFDNREKLTQYLQINEVTLLLIPEEKYEAGMEQEVKEVIFFTSSLLEEQLTKQKTQEHYRICFLQSAEAIGKKLLGVCANMDGMVLSPVLTGQKHAKIIGIYTPVGRCLQTSFALTMGQLLSEKKKLLYLNFETFSGFSVWFQGEYQTDLMDLLYYLEEPVEKFLLKLQAMTEHFGKFHYIPPAISYEDFVSVEKEKWVQLLERIAVNSDYEVILLDLAGSMRGLFDILGMCDRVITITRQDGLSMAKVDSFEKAFAISEEKTGIGKQKQLTKCSIPDFSNIPQSAQQLTRSRLAEFIREKLGGEWSDI